MTRRTTDALVYVYAVIEEDEIRQVMHTCPFDGLSGAETLTYWCQIRTVHKQL
jgi:hypothetical protein